MKERNIKIAIVSSSTDESAKIGMNLSEILKIPYICRESTDKEYQVIYNKGKKERYTSNEIYTTILAQFLSRIKKEKIPSFVSNGMVLNEIVLKKQEIHQTKILKHTFFYRILGRKFREFEKKVEKLIEDYAQNSYDRIYFLQNTDNVQNESFAFFEQAMLEILNRKRIDHAIICGNSESLLHDILNDLNKY